MEAVAGVTAPPPPLPFSHPSDLVRAYQKDLVCRGLLRQQVCEALEEVAGHRRASRWQAFAAVLSDVAYAVGTAVLAGRTLGEEYCELLAVTRAGGAAGLSQPSRMRRLIGASPALLQGLLPAGLPAAAARAGGTLGRGLIALCEATPLALRLNLAAFYLFGRFHHLSDRITQIRHVSLSERPYRDFTYRVLGAMLAVQVIGEVCARFVVWRRQFSDKARGEEARAAEALSSMGEQRWSGGAAGLTSTGHGRGDGGLDASRQPTCRICMCSADYATATPCGHLFCWECIATWCASKASCPLCRTASPPQQLLPLRHYETPPTGDARCL